ncbi:MAG: EAL domain-containing protein [Thermodesulfobacteriota bacterium]
MEKPSFSLSKKFFVFLIVILLPVISGFFYIYYEYKESIKRQNLDDLTVIADAYEGQVFAFLEMAKRRTEDFARDGFIMDELEKEASGAEREHAALDDHIVKNKLPLDHYVRRIFVATIEGKVVSSTDPSLKGTDISKEEFFIKGKKGTTVTELPSAPSGPIDLAISAPVPGKKTGEKRGVLTKVIPVSELNRVLSGELSRDLGAVSWNRGRGKTMEVYLVNRDGRIIAGTFTRKGGEGGGKIDTLPVRACLDSGKEISVFYKDFRGVDVAGASMCMPRLKWTLVVKYDAAEAVRPVLLLRKSASIVALVISGLVFLLFIVFYRRTVFYLKKIYSGATVMAGGDYSVEIPVETGDEIGALAAAFNGMASEINGRKKELTKIVESLKKAQEVAKMGSWDWDIAGNELSWSDEIYRIFGIDPDEFGASYEAFLGCVHPGDREFVKRAVNEALHNNKKYSIDHRIVLPEGGERVVHEEAEVVFEGGVKPLRMVGTVQDITERKKKEYELTKFSSVLERTMNAVLITDSEGKIEYANPMYEKIAGYSREEVMGRTPLILSPGETPAEVYKDIWETIRSGKTWTGEFKNRKKNGADYWCRCVVSPVMGGEGGINHYLVIKEDVTEKMASERKLAHITTHDHLTGLLNRARFMSLLKDLVLRGQGGYGARGALSLINVDRFMFLNDTYGHAMGDVFLRRLGKFINDNINALYNGYAAGKGGEPIAARLSGDEFAVFLPDVDGDGALHMAEEVRKKVEEAQLGVHGQSTISIGVVLYPEHGKDVSELLMRVDAAMMRAKELGRNRCHLYRPEDKSLEKMHSRLEWKAKIVSALKEGRFEPWFQPILCLKDNSVTHYEALARMIGEKGEVLFPGSFIEAAEVFGLIGSMDRIIIRKALDLQERMRVQGKALCFSLNLSGVDLGDEEFLTFLKGEVSKKEAASIVFEITETAAVKNMDKAIKFINELKKMGCMFSLDDFGVGFTSFNYLKEMDVDYIKIDGSFIRRLHENPDDQLFVKAMIDVARGMKIKTVAEFVETEEALNLLKKFKADYAQGYFIGRPGRAFF